MNLRLTTLSLFIASTVATTATAGVPRSMQLEVDVKDADGAAIHGQLTLHMALYDSQESDEPVWSNASLVKAEQGRVVVELEDIEAALLQANGNLFLGMSIGDDEEMSPRLAFLSVPYALRSSYADNALTDEDIKSSLQADPRFVSMDAPCDGRAPIWHASEQKWKCGDVPSVGGEGVMGPPGRPGPIGAHGSVGPAGPPGRDGQQGRPGIPVQVSELPVGDGNCPQGGVIFVDQKGNEFFACNAKPGGPQGLQGVPGPQGPAGVAGPMGTAGPQGPAGGPGFQGRMGPQGPAGAQGAKGPIGNSVEMLEINAGHPACPGGGTEFRVGNQSSYACNAEQLGLTRARREATVAANVSGIVNVSASCGVGETLMFGGCSASEVGSQLNQAVPDVGSNEFDCRFSSATIGTLTAYAVCAQ